jgi:DNA-directed RNA polymerase subunit RPC12/RpoP
LTLDKYLPPYETKPKPSAVSVEETCTKCGKPISPPKYTLKIKGEEKPYCRDCAKKILKPQENSEENV